MAYEGREAAARLLADLRTRSTIHAPIDELPEEIRPPDLMAAYQVQAALRRKLMRQRPGPQIGWKIGCTTPVMQNYLRIPHPCAGALYRGSVYRNQATLHAADFMTLGLECEIAVQLNRDLPHQGDMFARADVASAVGAVMASIEIVEHRFTDFRKASTPSLVADDFFSAGCVVGDAVTADMAGDLATLRGGFAISGARPDTMGTGAEILGHPLSALTWLADQAAMLGTPLQAGQIVTLGSVVQTIYPKPGEQIEARFTRLPAVRVDVI